MLGGYAKSLIGFRGSLIKALIEKGVDVVCSAAEDDQKVKDALLQMGARFRPINLSRTGANPFSDFSYYKNLRKLIREEK
ncbi:MAG: glycosyltransferase family 1 protein, partial [Candidatus Omnitrophica bacterium]|nr:glycosyltransferase family 1 protein [Candidatus Omnitrophota bacterium]